MADADPVRVLSKLKKRRGVVRASITQLGNRLKDMEAAPDAAGVGDHAKQLTSQLEALHKDFKFLHFDVVDLIDSGATADLEKEQDILDSHDDDMTSLVVCLQQVAAKSSKSDDMANTRKKSSSHKLSRLERSLGDT